MLLLRHDWRNLDIKKPLPAVTGVVLIHNEMEMNMHKILTDIELQRKIYLFQKAVEEHAEKRSLPTAQSVAVAKAELWAFIQGANA